MQHMKPYLSVAVCGFFTLLAATASAQTVVSTEDFNYADGSLATANPAWVNHSGTAGTLLVSGNTMLRRHPVHGRDRIVNIAADLHGAIEIGQVLFFLGRIGPAQQLVAVRKAPELVDDVLVQFSELRHGQEGLVVSR